MSDLRELYLEMVTDHAKNPRNRGKAEPCDFLGTGHNPLCGDKIVVTVSVVDDVIKDVKFDGEGCAISTASADLMATHIEYDQWKNGEKKKDIQVKEHAKVSVSKPKEKDKVDEVLQKRSTDLFDELFGDKS